MAALIKYGWNTLDIYKRTVKILVRIWKVCIFHLKLRMQALVNLGCSRLTGRLCSGGTYPVRKKNAYVFVLDKGQHVFNMFNGRRTRIVFRANLFHNAVIRCAQRFVNPFLLYGVATHRSLVEDFRSLQISIAQQRAKLVRRVLYKLRNNPAAGNCVRDFLSGSVRFQIPQQKRDRSQDGQQRDNARQNQPSVLSPIVRDGRRFPVRFSYACAPSRPPSFSEKQLCPADRRA